ncbi:TOPRIM nucleotidyl transferase/hydrolase domain-containing protein [Paenibacillus sp. MCAF9]|uniref:TOPRIM nucleotidyl transferase/hydrolase domain-containing protein n=1 Tax=unclassified Paenibacillus TaxID=185978 RepID=UPI003F9BEBF5
MEKVQKNEKTLEVESIRVNPFNISKAFKSLHEDDQTYVKMLFKIDDSIAKVFFARKILIIEGDTEDIVFRETINRMSEDRRKDVTYNWEIVKARGKATIISLVKYLKAMGFQPYVVHDLDIGTEHAMKFNEPIQVAVGSVIHVFPLANCIEDVLGYPAPSSNKPVKAYKHILTTWNQDWESVTEDWRKIVESIFFSSNEGQESVDVVLEEISRIWEAAPASE